MIYKIILSNGSNILVESDEELIEVIKNIQSGVKFVFTKRGFFNPSFLVGIEPDRERFADYQYNLSLGIGEKDIKKDLLGEPKMESILEIIKNKQQMYGKGDNKLIGK